MHLIPTQVVASVTRQKATPRKVQSVFREIVERAGHVSIAGKAKADPIALTAKHVPKHWIRLFDTDYFLSDVMQIPELRFFVGYVVKRMDSSRPKVFSRIFYKDLSLAWRVASHFTIEEEGELWVGKGDIRDSADGDLIESNEATTDLPLEMQTAVESLLQDSKSPKPVSMFWRKSFGRGRGIGCNLTVTLSPLEQKRRPIQKT